MVLTGDSAGMVNIPKLKGVHLAMHSGMFAAESIYQRLKAGGDCSDLSNYQEAVESSFIESDLYRSRNMRQALSNGLIKGGIMANIMEVSGGRLLGGHHHTHDDSDVDLLVTNRHKKYPKPDGKVTFDKLGSVFTTGNASRDDAPNHIRIQKNVPAEIAVMWDYMCPAQVYTVPDEIKEQLEKGNGSIEDLEGPVIDLEITPSNCVQCG